MKVRVQLVTYNGIEYISDLFESLKKQTLGGWELAVLDNNSSDGTAELIKASLQNFSVPHTFAVAQSNTGYAGGHNVLYDPSYEYCIVINQDMTLSEKCLESMVDFLDDNRMTATVTPAIMSMKDPARVDTLGLVVSSSGHAADIMHGQLFSDNLGGQELRLSVLRGRAYAEVFGVSGALFAGRTSAIGEQLYANNYFAYKEDVDLAWRVRHAGWKSHVLLDVFAYHDRTAGKSSWFSKSALVRRLSYRNHLCTMVRNIPVRVSVLWYELKKFVFLLFRDRQTLHFAYHHRHMIRSAYTDRSKLKKKVSSIEIKQWLM